MRSVRPLACVLGVVWAAVCVGAVSARQTVFRSTVDVIAVDVQVVDSEGNPIGRIGPELFHVSINGQQRKVVSAQFIGMQPTSDDPTEPRPPEGRGRTFVLAIDAGSFEVGSARATASVSSFTPQEPRSRRQRSGRHSQSLLAASLGRRIRSGATTI
jgi:hypothetical protein